MARWAENVVFQSTPSCEGEHKHRAKTRLRRKFQSTPSCEGEQIQSSSACPLGCFNPRPLARANAAEAAPRSSGSKVSIHALLRGRTSVKPQVFCLSWFQSTPSCEGERQDQYAPKSQVQRFQSTPSCEGEPERILERVEFIAVSIHALLRGRTFGSIQATAMSGSFQSTPSCEGERTNTALRPVYVAVSIHALLRGRTTPQNPKRRGFNVSIHALLRGRTPSRSCSPGP